MKVRVNDILDIYEKEVSSNTKNKMKVFNFEKNKMENIYDIIYIIEKGNYKVYRYNIFTINSPKYRIVMSLNIKDKIINHYVTRNILIPKLDGYLDIRNCATRRNMGYDYGIKLLKRYIECNKKYGKFYVLRIDISKYFYSIDHNVLKEMLINKLDSEEYDIVCSILDSTNDSYVNDRINFIKSELVVRDSKREKEISKLPIYEYDKGLPIGNMTSQFLSIFYLYGLDYYIVNYLGLKFMVRYMDDYVIISNDKERLMRALVVIRTILKDEYGLGINENKTGVFDSYNGFEYLGYMFYVRDGKTIIKMKCSNRKKRCRGKRKVNFRYDNNDISYREYFNSMSNYKNGCRYGK